MSEKLQKVLARSGQGSRREIELMIQNGRVSVNGEVATLGDRIEELTSTIVRVDGHQIQLVNLSDEVCRVLAYNKPEGELCTRHDPEGRRTVFDRLPILNEGRWVSVGRLDANTSGLLLFTTDGELANRLMHPSHTVQREYMVRVFGEINEHMVKNLVRGVELEDGLARFEDVVYAGGEGMNHTFYVVITEGRNREVRRLWDSQGVTVSRLKRVRYGDIYLTKDLPRGGWKELELTDVNYLRESVALPAETETLLTVEGLKRKKDVRQIRRAVRRHETRVKSDGSDQSRSRGISRQTPNVEEKSVESKKPSRARTGKPSSKPSAKPNSKPSSKPNAKPNARPSRPSKPVAPTRAGRVEEGNKANRRDPMQSMTKGKSGSKDRR
jgi:23S rRNA pseudouridine2605 synthase